MHSLRDQIVQLCFTILAGNSSACYKILLKFHIPRYITLVYQKLLIHESCIKFVTNYLLTIAEKLQVSFMLKKLFMLVARC